MKKNRFYSLLVCLVLAFFLVKTDAFPRAGRGQSYRAPRRSAPRRSTSRRSTPSYRRSTSNRYTSTRNNYTSTRNNYGSGTTRSSNPRAAGACCGGSILVMLIGLFVFIMIIVLIVKSLKKKKGGKDENKAKGGIQSEMVAADELVDVNALPPIDEEKVKAQLAELVEKDPHFSEKVFLDKAQTAYRQIQRYWSKNDLEPVNKYMSKAMYDRMNMDIEEFKDKGWVNKVDNVVIGSIKIDEAGVEGDHHFIKTRIHASMSDQTFDADGKLVEGSPDIKPVAEYWTFIRKMGAKTNEDGGRTVSHNCPSCGAPIDAGEGGRCEYCDAVITKASFDWVLDTITHAYEEMMDYQGDNPDDGYDDGFEE